MDFFNFNKLYQLQLRFDVNGLKELTALDLFKAIESGSEIIIDPESEWFKQARLSADLEALDNKPHELSPLVLSLTRAEAAKQAEAYSDGDLETENGEVAND